MRATLAKVKRDVEVFAAAESRRPNAAFWLRMVLITPGFQFVLSRRVLEALAAVPVVGRPLRRISWWLACIIHSSEVALSAKIGGGLYVPHPYGIVIGECVIGENVVIMQHVTIGHKFIIDEAVPVIGDGAILGVGCAVLGAITIGEGAVVGANSVVLSDVQPGCIAVGAPARVIDQRNSAQAWLTPAHQRVEP